MSAAILEDDLTAQRRSKFYNRIVYGIILALLLLRAPLIYRQPGGLDEEWYAVPGYTVSRTGVPRIPYCPARNQDSFFYHADEILFALPPLYFYWQAPWFWLLPAGYGTARLSSLIAGGIAIWLVFQLGKKLFHDDRVAALGAGLYSLSRMVIFPAMTARPDLFCAMWGLAAILLLCNWRDNPSPPNRWLIAAGLCLGCGLLSHPFAIVFCLQCGFWVLWQPRHKLRALYQATLLTLTTLVCASLWSLLILQAPTLFQQQFFGNVLGRSGPGLLSRMLLPGESIVHHFQLLRDLLGSAQLLLIGLTAGGVMFFLLSMWTGASSTAMKRLQPAAWVTLGAIYLLIVCQGTHPSKVYWCYPAAFLTLWLAQFTVSLTQFLYQHNRWISVMPLLILSAIWLPGSGVRTLHAHITHWNDPAYNAPLFTERLIQELPEHGTVMVDPAYIFPVWLKSQHTPRTVLLANGLPQYFRSQDYQFDALLISQYGLDAQLPQLLQTQPIATFGTPNDTFACYAELHQPRD